jgi:hypothetical protein
MQANVLCLPFSPGQGAICAVTLRSESQPSRFYRTRCNQRNPASGHRHRRERWGNRKCMTERILILGLLKKLSSIKQSSTRTEQCESEIEDPEGIQCSRVAALDNTKYA